MDIISVTRQSCSEAASELKSLTMGRKRQCQPLTKGISLLLWSSIHDSFSSSHTLLTTFYYPAWVKEGIVIVQIFGHGSLPEITLFVCSHYKRNVAVSSNLIFRFDANRECYNQAFFLKKMIYWNYHLLLNLGSYLNYQLLPFI